MSDCCFLLLCPRRDGFKFYVALKISFLQRSKNFVLGKVSLISQQNFFQHQKYEIRTGMEL